MKEICSRLDETLPRQLTFASLRVIFHAQLLTEAARQVKTDRLVYRLGGIMLRLCYSALSPYCRKVRMAMDHMQLNFELFDSCDIRKYPAFNPRAEIPILEDGGVVVVRNSSTILDYLHVRFPEAPSLLPDDPTLFATCKDWELTADTMIDPIVTNCAIFKFGDLPPPPKGLLEAAENDIAAIYDRLDEQLVDKDFVAGEISIADLALYPHLLAAQRIGLPVADRHRNVAAWLARFMQLPIGQSDWKAVLDWWKNRENQDVETDRINWGTYRLEWFLAHGFHEWLYNEIRRDAVLWSVGPRNNARLSPLYPAEVSQGQL
jgi:glutathione S-transferase